MSNSPGLESLYTTLTMSGQSSTFEITHGLMHIEIPSQPLTAQPARGNLFSLTQSRSVLTLYMRSPHCATPLSIV